MTFTAVDSTGLPRGPEIQVVSTATADGTLYVTTLLDSGGKPIATSSAVVSAASSAIVASSITSNTTPFNISGRAAGGSASGALNLFTGDTLLTNVSGDLLVYSGTSVSGNSGVAWVYSGNSKDGTTGSALIGSGDATGTGSSGNVLSGSGNAVTGSTGSASLYSGNVSSAGDSGLLQIGSGNSASGTTGPVTISTGTAAGANKFSGDILRIIGTVSGGAAAGAIYDRGIRLVQQAAPTALTTSATLTAAQVLVGLLTANQGGGASASYQMPTGTDLQNAFSANLSVNDSFDFSLVNISTNAAETATFTVNTDVTTVGNMTVAANSATTTISAGKFRLRKTANHTFVLYRIG